MLQFHLKENLTA